MLLTIQVLMKNKTCLLCQTNKVYEIESHLTPAGITKNTFGERNSEKIFTIYSSTKRIELYYGRNHPQKIIQEIKTPPNSRKGKFCKICEDNIRNYETAVHPVMNNFLTRLAMEDIKSFEHQRTIRGLKLT